MSEEEQEARNFVEETLTQTQLPTFITNCVKLKLPEVIEKHEEIDYKTITKRIKSKSEQYTLRFLRALAAYKIFQEIKDGVFSHTPRSLVLREDSPASINAKTCFFDCQLEAWSNLDQIVINGDSHFKNKYNKTIWQYLEGEEILSQKFDEYMTNVSNPIIKSICSNEEIIKKLNKKTIIDVAGGRGHLVISLLLKSKESTGIVFDLENVIKQGIENSKKLENVVQSRLEFKTGSFFDDEIPTGDIYLLKWILHDWGDDESIKILSNVKNSIMKNKHPQECEVLILDAIMDSSNNKMVIG
eukprot:gene11211-4033_t